MVVGGLLSWVFIFALIVAGTLHAPVWLIVPAAFIGSGLYVMVKGGVSQYWGRAPIQLALTVLGSQAVFAALLYGIGYLVSLVFR